MKRLPISNRGLVICLIVLFGFTIAITFLTPLERTLGGNLRLIYLHGAWVWTGIVTFCASGIIGFLALLLRNQSLHSWSRATGWTGLCFWVTYLPMSMAVMQINWNGLFFDEPRWKVPFTFAVIGILLQAGLLLINTPRVTSLANIGFASALMFNLLKMESVLHPDSPVFSSGSSGIKWIFILLFTSTIIMSGVLSYLWIRCLPWKASVPAEKEK
jgi:hypothetical protein